MLDQHLTTACPRMDQSASLAGLKILASTENRMARRTWGRIYDDGGDAKAAELLARDERRALVLDIMPDREPVHIADLARTLGWTSGSVHGVITALARRGQVRRVAYATWQRVP